ncbi:MAG: ABC transporter ATP-binding protein [Cellulosilyticaceae bacterium]
MFKLMRHMKKSILPILAIVLLLVVQAVCDLSLPDYTSKIVNVGIQQGGVEDAVPMEIRKETFDKLLNFIPETEEKQILENYILEDDVLKLNTKDEEILEELNITFARAILVVKAIESGEGMMEMGMEIPEGMNMFDIIQMMPEEQRAQMQKEMTTKFDAIPESIMVQSATDFIKSEYEQMGLDTEKMQNSYILKVGGIMLLIALLSMVATVIVGFLGARVAATLGRDVRGKVFKKVVSFSNTEMDKFSTASLITRSTNDIQQVQMLMVMLLRVVFYAPILGVGGFIKVLGTDTSMAWIIGVAVLSILSVVMLLIGIAMPRFKKLQKLVDRVNLVMREILTGILVIRAFSTEKHEKERFDEANKTLTKTTLFVNRVMAMMMPIMMLIMNLITVLIVWNGAHSIDNGAMQVGDMMAFIQYTMQIIMSFLMISMVSIMLPRAAVSAQRIEEVLATEEVIKEPSAVGAEVADKKGIVSFKNVSFKYPNAEEEVLQNISFDALPGQTTAIIGSTGSGKSTLINLLPRFYDVTSGEILIDGVCIKEIPTKKLRDKIGYVPQKAMLFSGTIDSNLRYGKKDATKEQLERAARIAQAQTFIEQKEEGYEANIAQGGGNISGGQKQRLSIARAIAKDPEVYIFDDSFSALDYKTDVVLRRALKEETENSTVIIVAQRISTIINADMIIVLEEGRIVGQGTHEELLKDCDVYKEIALSQLSKEELS